jgi:hypothetical protein
MMAARPVFLPLACVFSILYVPYANFSPLNMAENFSTDMMFPKKDGATGTQKTTAAPAF